MHACFCKCVVVLGVYVTSSFAIQVSVYFSLTLSNALEVSREMGDSAFEAQSCYSLGNTFTLMEDYHKAIEYHLTHLQFALQLDDRCV